MMILKVITFVICANAVKGDGFDWFLCVQKAISEGVLSLGIPRLNPLVQDTTFKTILINPDIEIADVAYNLTWYNIPWWEDYNFTEIFNDDMFSVTEYNMYWQNFTIIANYRYTVNNLQEEVVSEEAGYIHANLTDVNWNGTVEVSKATSNSSVNIIKLKINWTNGNVDALINGTVDANKAVNNIMGLFNYKNSFGDYLRDSIDTKLLENINLLSDLQHWCEN